MKKLLPLLAFTATPAFAHHEVIATTSALPVLMGLAVIVVAATTAVRQRFGKKSPDRKRSRKTHAVKG